MSKALIKAATPRHPWAVKDGLRMCIACKVMLPVENFGQTAYTTKAGNRSMRYSPRCRPCDNARRVARYAFTKERETQTTKEWHKRNAAYRKEYAAKRQATEEVRAMKAAYQRERKQRMKAGGGAKDPAVGELYLQARLEEQKLRACVSSDDDLDLQVHVDHRVPLSKGGLHVLENLQILSGRANLEKGTRL